MYRSPEEENVSVTFSVRGQGRTDLSRRRKGKASGDQGQTDLSTRRKNGALGQIRLSLGPKGSQVSLFFWNWEG
jgi:hypothetical protein